VTLTHRSPKHRLRLVAVVVTVVAVIAAVIVYVVVQVPDYRTAFILDTSASTSSGAGADFNALIGTVSSAAQNVGDRDALSLRRFGGTCGDDPHNTAQIVGSGIRNGQQISNAVHTLTRGGNATLQSGILAAIDDFSGFYPFRGTKSNRIIVVTSHGTDACTHDQAALTKKIRDRIDAAGLQLEFRFVGYKVPDDQRDTLAQVAAATRAPEPKFVQTAADLTTTLKQLTIPGPTDAAPVKIPSISTTVPPSPTVSSSPRESVVPTSARPSPGLPDGQHFGYIKSVDVPARVIVIDEIQYMEGKEANAAAREDGKATTECAGPDGLPGVCDNHYIRNTNPRTYKLQLSADATITANDLLTWDDKFNVEQCWQISHIDGCPVTLQKLASLLAEHQTETNEYTFGLTVFRGRVTSLQERHIP
jgi:hypothetical protein